MAGKGVMTMGGFYWQPRCSCGQQMKYTPDVNNIPLEVVLPLAMRGIPLSVAMRYECPKGHECFWYIPTLGDDAEARIRQKI